MTLGVLPFFRIRLRKSDSWFRDGFQVLLFFFLVMSRRISRNETCKATGRKYLRTPGCIYFLTVVRKFPFGSRIKVPSKGASKPRTKFVAKEEPTLRGLRGATVKRSSHAGRKRICKK